MVDLYKRSLSISSLDLQLANAAYVCCSESKGLGLLVFVLDDASPGIGSHYRMGREALPQQGEGSTEV